MLRPSAPASPKRAFAPVWGDETPLASASRRFAKEGTGATVPPMAPRPLFVVPVADLEDGPKEETWSIPETFLSAALEGTEATPRGAGEVHATLSKTGREVVVLGRIEAPLTMPCARTLDPVPIDVAADLHLLLSPGPATSPGPRKRQAGGARAEKKGKVEEEESILTDEDTARDSYDGEQVVLDAFVREFIVLELPMFPLRSDLHSDDGPAIDTAPKTPDDAKPLDPRLAPLAVLASRMRDTKE